MEARGAIAIRGDGAQREILLESWIGTKMKHGVVINEGEECKTVKPRTDGDYLSFEPKREKSANRAAIGPAGWCWRSVIVVRRCGWGLRRTA